MKRCAWATTPLMIEYHDGEWGEPTHDDRVLFEFVLLEGAQAGLSWDTVLRKRERYRDVFEAFDPKRVARFTERDVTRLMKDDGIIRNRAKIQSAIGNAKAFIAVQNEFGSFDRYLWGYVDRKPVVRRPRSTTDIPATSPLSERLSKDLRKRGFRFVGSTICYAYLQAVGVINDHLASCFKSRK